MEMELSFILEPTITIAASINNNFAHTCSSSWDTRRCGSYLSTPDLRDLLSGYENEEVERTRQLSGREIHYKQSRESIITNEFNLLHCDQIQSTKTLKCTNAYQISTPPTRRFSCYTTGMIALPNPMSHVNSAAFAQARPRAGSASAQVCLGLLTLPYTLTRNY